MSNLFRKHFGGSSNPPQVGTDRSSGEAYLGSATPSSLYPANGGRHSCTAPEAPAWGVLMETGYPEATATLFALSDGTTSLYLSSGGGVIGGHAHQSMRQANAALLDTANQYYQHLKPSESFPVPVEGHTLFYVLTDSGAFLLGLAVSMTSDLVGIHYPLY